MNDTKLNAKEFCDEFMRGMSDCKNGNPHKRFQSLEYDRGYSAQYAHEQNMTALSEAQYGH